MYRKTSILLLVAFVACVFSFSTIVEAKPEQAMATQAAQRHKQGRPVAASWDGLPFGRADLVAEARRYIGTNPTGWKHVWCARFMNFVLERRGYATTGSDAASSFATYGQRIAGPQVGAIAVMRRKGGGHVGIVSGVAKNGEVIVISGNSAGHVVGVAHYPRGRIYAYVLPN